MIFMNSDLYTVALLFFLLAGVSIYALIQTRKNYIVVFFLTPILLASTLYSAKIVYSLLGSPIRGFPTQTVDITYVYPLDPYIYFLASDTDSENPEPKYYRVPYTKENQQMMKKLQQKAANGQKVQGKFKKSQGNSGSKEFERYFFEPHGSRGPSKASDVDANDERNAWISMENNPQVPPQFQERLRNPHTMNGVDGVEPDDPSLFSYPQ